MPPEAIDRFFRRLHPEIHLAPEGDGGYRVSSAAFKGTPKDADGRYVTSVDAEWIRPLDEERSLVAKFWPEYGIGGVLFGTIDECGAEARPTPLPDNPAHHDILCNQGQARKLADATQIIDWRRRRLRAEPPGRNRRSLSPQQSFPNPHASAYSCGVCRPEGLLFRLIYLARRSIL